MAIALPPIKPVSYNSAMLVLGNLISFSTTTSTINSLEFKGLNLIFLTFPIFNPFRVTGFETDKPSTFVYIILKFLFFSNKLIPFK